MRPHAAFLGLLLVGCGSAVPVGADTDGAETSPSSGVSVTTATSGSGTTATTTTSRPASTDTTGPRSTTVDPATGSSPGDSSSSDTLSGTNFISDIGDTGMPHDCSIWDQDCPDGQKCTVWASDGGFEWNATRCVEIDPQPDAVGEACTAEGDGLSGVDSCELGTLCWDLDGGGNGECIALCEGSRGDPSCSEPEIECSISAAGPLALCLPSCDPLIQDCDVGEACYLAGSDLVCAPDASEAMGTDGDSCDSVNTCDPGLACIVGTVLADCDGEGCCTPFCSVSGPDSCTDPAESCVPLFPETGFPSQVDFGICGIEE